MNDYDLQQYQFAALNACAKFGEDPYQPLPWPDGSTRPVWMHRAAEMHRLRILHNELRSNGMLF